MRDGCWVPGCKGEIQPNRDLRSTVARGGECTVCGARYRCFGSGDWKFETERIDCPKDGCDGFVELEVRADRATEGACWKCDTKLTREPGGSAEA